jgi:hypothetical protein
MSDCKGLKGSALKKCMESNAVSREKKKDSLVVVRTEKRDSIMKSRHNKRIKAGTPSRSTSFISNKKKN